MGHFGSWNSRVKTPTAWLPVARDVGATVNLWSGRNDLVATVSKDAGRGQAAALFDPIEAKVEINTKAAFGKGTTPADIGAFTTRKAYFRYPQAAGAIFHEAMHAKHTSFDLKAMSKALNFSEARAMMNLEESRIEKHGILSMPENKAFLRSCILNMVMSDTKDPKYKKLSKTRQTVHVMALTLARVDTGVLTEKNVKSIRREIDAVLDEDTQKKFRALWIEFQMITDPTRDLQKMYRIAREWDALTQETADAKGEKPEEEQDFIVIHISGPMPEDDGSGGGEPEDEDGPMIIAIYDDAANTETEATKEVHSQEDSEDAAEAKKEREAIQKEVENHKEKARQVFNHVEKPTGHTSSKLQKSRAATTEERVAAVTIARALDKARYRDRVKTETYNVTPPGRMRTRALVTDAANRSKGIYVPVEPFRRVRHQHVEDPDLTVGMMVDISGSMGSAMNPMGAAAWIMAEAVHRIQGKTAMVYYGDSVFPTLYPGQRLPQVNIYNAPDGSEAFDTAFKALDGELGLLHGTGARLLVIASDGQYIEQERKACKKWMERCRADGVGVLWLGFGWYAESDSAGATFAKAAGGSYIVPSENVTDSAAAIGKAGADALTRAGSGR